MTATDSGAGLAAALSAFASGVTLVTVADGRDDVGTTVSAFCPVSLEPPLVLVSLIADSYPAELLGRLDRFAVTILAAGQRALAGRFAVAGRPGARLMLDGVPHQRGSYSGALIPDGGLAALEGEVTQRVPHRAITQAINVVVFIERTATGRRIRDVSRLVGRENDAYVLEPVREPAA